MAPPLPEASHPSNTTPNGGPSCFGPICPPRRRRRCTRRSCASESCFLYSFLLRCSVRSTSSRRLMASSLAPVGELRLGMGARSPGSGTMEDAMTALPLVFDAPRRGMPPRHLADLTREEARAAVAELGQPPFRPDQLARHFYR